MDTIQLLDNKINELKNMVTNLRTSNLNELDVIKAQIIIIEECENILTDESLMINYDFSKVIELLNNQNMTIENLEKILSEIQQVIDVKIELNIPNIEFTNEQLETLKIFKENLKKAKEQLQIKLDELELTNNNDEDIENLEDLKNILQGIGKRKYYTDEMIDSLFRVVDFENMPMDEFDSLIKDFYNTRNLKVRQHKEKESLDNVIELYKEFLEENEFKTNESGKFIGLFGMLINKYSEEITTFIDLDNTREILQFFKEKSLLNKFGRNALLKVSLFSNSEYVKKLYNNIINNYPQELELYFEDCLATLWVCDGKATKKRAFRISRKNSKDENKDDLYSQCHSITEEEFRENVKYLNDNWYMFDEKYNAANFGAHLKAKTIPTEELKNFKTLLELVTKSAWSFRKNLGLFKQFDLGNITKIPITSLELGDVEDKIHLAIELGLLNPPMTEIYKELDKDIVKHEEFQRNQSKKNIQNQSIRNYFARNITILSSMSINEYAYLFYKLKSLGELSFYNTFFSGERAGKRSGEYITFEEEMIISDKEKMDELVTTNFVTEFYSDFINGYDEYDSVISNYNEENKIYGYKEKKYFDNDILNDELIQVLEENNTIINQMTSGEEIIEIKNEYLYKFGNTLISRYKVLHNATILKEHYGYLDKDMLMSSIIRNSFLNEDDLINIQNCVQERNMLK